MKFICISIISLILAPAAPAQSLGDFARKERERKAQQKAGIQVSTDEVRTGKVDLSPPLDPARKSDLNYLLQQLSHPKASPDLLAAFVPLKDQAVPRLLSVRESSDPFKRIAPATVLMVLGNSEGLASIARLLSDTSAEMSQSASTPPATASAKENAKSASGAATGAPSPEPTAKGTDQTPTVAGSTNQPAAKQAPNDSGAAPPSDEVLRKKIEQSRVFAYALDATKLGVWRFTEGSTLTPDQVVQRLRSGPAIELVGGPDNGQRIFNRALRDPDTNLRRGAIALIRVANNGADYGYQPDQATDQNESAIQQITSFLTTERSKVISQLGSKTP